MKKLFFFLSLFIFSNPLIAAQGEGFRDGENQDLAVTRSVKCTGSTALYAAELSGTLTIYNKENKLSIKQLEDIVNGVDDSAYQTLTGVLSGQFVAKNSSGDVVHDENLVNLRGATDFRHFKKQGVWWFISNLVQEEKS